jgi:hypothetical protein
MRSESIQDVEQALLNFDLPAALGKIQQKANHDLHTTELALIRLRNNNRAVQVTPRRWLHVSKNIRCVHNNIVVRGEAQPCGCHFDNI